MQLSEYRCTVMLYIVGVLTLCYKNINSLCTSHIKIKPSQAPFIFIVATIKMKRTCEGLILIGLNLHFAELTMHHFLGVF